MLEPSEIIEKYTNYRHKQISIEEIEQINNISLIKLEEIKEEYREIYKLIAEEEGVNEISIKTKMSMQDLYQKLFLMEMEGLIESGNNRYKIIK